jgi:hypothetical protein
MEGAMNSINVMKGVNPVEYWISRNRPEIIECPHQPGNLKITKDACQKRHRQSEKVGDELVNQMDLFHYTIGQGLLRCRNCSLVKQEM